MLGAGQAFQNSRKTGIEPLTTAREGVIIRVKNTTGSVLPTRSVLGLNGPLFPPAELSQNIFLREVVFVGVIPDLSVHKIKFCVTMEPATEDQVIRAYLGGVCQVLVNLVDLSHDYANIDGGNTANLKSSRHGHARLLWTEAEDPYSGYSTGVQWSLAWIGVTGSSIAIGKALGDISPRVGSVYGSGNVGLYRSNSGNEEGPLETIAVLNPSDTLDSPHGTGISAGTYVSVAWDEEDVAWVGPMECPPGVYG